MHTHSHVCNNNREEVKHLRGRRGPGRNWQRSRRGGNDVAHREVEGLALSPSFLSPLCFLDCGEGSLCHSCLHCAVLAHLKPEAVDPAHHRPQAMSCEHSEVPPLSKLLLWGIYYCDKNLKNPDGQP